MDYVIHMNDLHLFSHLYIIIIIIHINMVLTTFHFASLFYRIYHTNIYLGNGNIFEWKKAA